MIGNYYKWYCCTCNSYYHVDRLVLLESCGYHHILRTRIGNIISVDNIIVNVIAR